MSLATQISALATRVATEIKAVRSEVTSGLSGKVGTSRTISTTSPLTGGGDLSANRTLAVTTGTTAGTVAAGDDGRFTDTRTPTDGTVTNAKVDPAAAIAESKLSLASDAAAGTASRRTLGTGSSQAAAGNHGHAGADITSGTVAYARLPVGTTASSTVADGGHTHGKYVWTMADYGLVGWSADPTWAPATGAAPASGASRLVRVMVPTAATITNIVGVIITAGATLTASQSWIGLYDTSFNRLGVSATQHTAWTTTGIKTMALTTPYAAAAGEYYVAFVSNGTTIPQFQLVSSSSVVPGLGRTSTDLMAMSGNASITTLPSTLTPGAVSLRYWFGLS